MVQNCSIVCKMKLHLVQVNSSDSPLSAEVRGLDFVYPAPCAIMLIVVPVQYIVKRSRQADTGRTLKETYTDRQTDKTERLRLNGFPKQ